MLQSTSSRRLCEHRMTCEAPLKMIKSKLCRVTTYRTCQSYNRMIINVRLAPSTQAGLSWNFGRFFPLFSLGALCQIHDDMIQEARVFPSITAGDTRVLRRCTLCPSRWWERDITIPKQCVGKYWRRQSESWARHSKSTSYITHICRIGCWYPKHLFNYRPSEFTCWLYRQRLASSDEYSNHPLLNELQSNAPTLRLANVCKTRLGKKNTAPISHLILIILDNGIRSE